MTNLHVLMLSNDPRLLDAESPVRERMYLYGAGVQELHIVVWSDSTDYGPKRDNVHIHVAHSRSKWGYFWSVIKIGRKILRSPGQWLITSQDAITNIPAFYLQRKYRARLQVQVHTDFLSPFFVKQNFLNRVRRLFYGWGIKKADCVRVVSERIKASITKTYGVSARKIAVLPLYVAPLRGEAVHGRHGMHKRTVLVVSRLTQEKNIPLTLNTFIEARKTVPGLKLVIVGDGPERQNVQEFCMKHSLENEITLTGWKHDVRPYYKNADALLVTSDYEGYGLTIIEALRERLPVVSTDVGIASEVGAFVCDRNPQSLARGIMKALTVDRDTIKLPKTMSKEEYVREHNRLWHDC